MKKLLTLILASTAFVVMADDTAANGGVTTATPASPATASPVTTNPSATTVSTTTTPTAYNGEATNATGSDGSGLYVGVGAGMGWNNQSSPAATFRLDGGYNFDQFWAFEVGTTGLTQSGGAYNQNMQYYDASIKGTLPLSQMYDIFAQVGGAYGAPGSVSGSIPAGSGGGSGVYKSSWNFMSGVGVDMSLTKNVALNLSDLYYYGPSAGIQGNTNVLLLGFKYKM